MQLAFARIKESWDDAYLADLNARPLDWSSRRSDGPTRSAFSPASGARRRSWPGAMLDRGLDGYRAFVCENLGSPDERVTQADLPELATMEFDPIHVLILVRDEGPASRPERTGTQLRFGNLGDEFRQRGGRRSVVTDAEVRAIAIAQMNLYPDSIVWDVGAGSGSVAIEAARLATSGTVFAVEPRADELELIRSNAGRFGVSNVREVEGRAPAALADLPDPDAVFVGGSGRAVESIVLAAFTGSSPAAGWSSTWRRSRPWSRPHRLLKPLTRDVAVWDVHVSRGVEQFDRLRFQAVNPSYLLAASKPG